MDSKVDFSLLEKNEYVEKWLEWVKKIPRKAYKSKKKWEEVDYSIKKGCIKYLNEFLKFLEKNPEKIILDDKIEINKAQLKSFYYYLIGKSEFNQINEKFFKKPLGKYSAWLITFSILINFFNMNGKNITFLNNELPKKNKRTVGSLFVNLLKWS